MRYGMGTDMVFRAAVQKMLEDDYREGRLITRHLLASYAPLLNTVNFQRFFGRRMLLQLI